LTLCPARAIRPTGVHVEAGDPAGTVGPPSARARGVHRAANRIPVGRPSVRLVHGTSTTMDDPAATTVPAAGGATRGLPKTEVPFAQRDDHAVDRVGDDGDFVGPERVRSIEAVHAAERREAPPPAPIRRQVLRADLVRHGRDAGLERWKARGIPERVPVIGAIPKQVVLRLGDRGGAPPRLEERVCHEVAGVDPRVALGLHERGAEAGQWRRRQQELIDHPRGIAGLREQVCVVGEWPVRAVFHDAARLRLDGRRVRGGRGGGDGEGSGEEQAGKAGRDKAAGSIVHGYRGTWRDERTCRPWGDGGR